MHINLLFLFIRYETRKFYWFSLWLALEIIIIFVESIFKCMFCKANLMRMILLYIKVETLQESTVFLSWQLQLIDHNVLVSTVAWRKILLLNFIAPLKKFGRYLDRMLIYNELLPSLLSGYYLPVVRIRVTSKKLTTFKFVSQVILRSKSSLKIFIKAFLILSSWGPLLYPKQAYQANQAKQAN